MNKNSPSQRHLQKLSHQSNSENPLSNHPNNYFLPIKHFEKLFDLQINPFLDSQSNISETRETNVLDLDLDGIASKTSEVLKKETPSPNIDYYLNLLQSIVVDKNCETQ